MNYIPFLSEFKIIKDPYGESHRVAYHVVSPQAAKYSLIRNENDKHLFFVFAEGRPKIDNIMGEKWFSDSKGFLDVVGTTVCKFLNTKRSTDYEQN